LFYFSKIFPLLRSEVIRIKRVPCISQISEPQKFASIRPEVLRSFFLAVVAGPLKVVAEFVSAFFLFTIRADPRADSPEIFH